MRWAHIPQVVAATCGTQLWRLPWQEHLARVEHLRKYGATALGRMEWYLPFVLPEYLWERDRVHHADVPSQWVSCPSMRTRSRQSLW